MTDASKAPARRHFRRRQAGADGFGIGIMLLLDRPGFQPELPVTAADVNLSIHPARAIARRLPRVIIGLFQSLRGADALPWVGALLRYITTADHAAPIRRIGTFDLAVLADPYGSVTDQAIKVWPFEDGVNVKAALGAWPV
jgi:hypothetical protein